MRVQEEIRNGTYHLIWSYLLDYENSKNPFQERREQIAEWKKYAVLDVVESKEVLRLAAMLQDQGIKKIDSLHIACAIEARSDYFLTTDDGILKKATCIQGVNATDTLGFIKEVLA